MSYILDALKKAEEERNLGTVPSVHTHAPFGPPTSNAAPPWRKPRSWAAFAIAAIAAALAALFLLRPWHSEPPAPQAVTAPAPAQAPPPVASAPATDAKEALPKPVEPKAPPAREASPKKPVRAADAPTPTPKAKPAPAPEPKESRVAGLNELPASIQAEIPSLTIGGYIYSSNKADRTVLINRRLLREGDEVAPDLTLERLTPSGMVLNYKGFRYRASY
jgi:general secretion pathway protein B